MKDKFYGQPVSEVRTFSLSLGYNLQQWCLQYYI